MMQELLLFARSLAAGAMLLSVYDLLRAVRRAVPHRDWLVSLEDGIYWIFDTAFIFGMLYRETGGLVRGYVILGILAGMLLYSLLLSRFVVGVLASVLTGICRAAAAVTWPARRFWGWFWGRHIKLWKNRLKKRGKHLKIKIYNLFWPDIGDAHEDEEKEKKI